MALFLGRDMLDLPSLAWFMVWMPCSWYGVGGSGCVPIEAVEGVMRCDNDYRGLWDGMAVMDALEGGLEVVRRGVHEEGFLGLLDLRVGWRERFGWKDFC